MQDLYGAWQAIILEEDGRTVPAPERVLSGLMEGSDEPLDRA